MTLLRCWSMWMQKCLKTYPGHTDTINDLSVDKKHVASTCQDTTVRGILGSDLM